MINVGQIILSGQFRQVFTLERSTGSFRSGGWVEDTPEVFDIDGAVIVAGPKDLRQVPEADRVLGAMCFYSNLPLYETHEDITLGTSDRILWRNEWYRLTSVFPYIDYGYYKAIGVRIKGA